jgi:monoamine oxidase
MRERPSRRWLLAWAASVASACGSVAPQPSAARSPASKAPLRVLVVGAGLAGLACAYRLLTLGHAVTVLEATLRAGGRICTVRSPWREGRFVEAGASHLVADPSLMALLAELNVALESHSRSPELSRVSLSGGQRRVRVAGAPSPPTQGLSAQEEALGEEALMDHYLAAASSYDPMAPFPARLLELDDVSAAEYLRRQGASPAFLREVDAMLAVGDTGLDGMSALWLVQSWSQILRERKFGASLRIAGGFDQLPAALARRLGERVLYGARVVRATQHAGSVSVVFEHAGTHSTLECERLVLAIPPALLSELALTPALSAEKRAALAGVALESVTRIWLETDRPFWIERGESGRVDTDLSLGPIRDESEGFPGRSGVLGLYVTRAESRRLAALAEASRIQVALELAEQAHPGLREHFVSAASKAWDNEPFQRGAYAYFKPGQVRALLPQLGRAEARYHFCGDHTSQRPGFMHGALASAWRVVEEIQGR